MATNHIIRMKSQAFAPKRENAITYTETEQKQTESDYTRNYPYIIDTMTTPELRVLQEIKMMLLILIIIKLICLLRRK